MREKWISWAGTSQSSGGFTLIELINSDIFTFIIVYHIYKEEPKNHAISVFICSLFMILCYHGTSIFYH